MKETKKWICSCGRVWNRMPAACECEREDIESGSFDSKVCKRNIKTKSQAEEYIASLKSRVAKNNAIIWFIKNRGWYC